MFYSTLIFLFFSSTFVRATDYLPFSPALPLQQSFGDIFRRDSKCAVSCGSMGANMCCGKKSVCALDQAGNVACCPFNAACTGSVAAGPAQATTAAAGVAPTPGAAISHAISGTSTISNQYYPFPVLPTPFANEAVCSTAYSVCQAESAKCTGYVEGGGYGVTIMGQNGQITQQAAGMPAASAESICASLSKEACHNLQPSQCPTLGIAQTTGGSNGGFTLGNSQGSGVRRSKGLNLRWLTVGVCAIIMITM